MTYVIVHALAPIFIIMLLGFWAGKAKMVDNKNVSLLNIFVMDFALPATLFSATVQTPWTGILAPVAANSGTDAGDVDYLCGYLLPGDNRL
ncbi:putative transporter YfdV [Salmonella enterica subsp. arizonae]|uniref:Putative transporter YfdV n=1 Tax=Salmonella enterica subsp. arizonae TaxID=59203 RepID=A0A379T7C0_SALER|nr:putative transporter YfdV [Salmonella enterica subsp. arizonae]